MNIGDILNDCDAVRDTSVTNGWAEDEYAKAKKMGVKERLQYLQDNGGKWVQKYGMKDAKAAVDKIKRIRGKKIQSGRFAGKIGYDGWEFVADYTDDTWYANNDGIDGTNLVRLEILAPGPGFEGDTRNRHVAGTFYKKSRWLSPRADEKSKAEKYFKKILSHDTTVKIGDDSYAWNAASLHSKNAVVANALAWKGSTLKHEAKTESV